ncbi:unnamed protein product, partial [Adineta ricciae]
KFRSYFNIHRLPSLSLLKVGGKEVTKQYVPSIKIAHGPGSILPLTCAHQHLFSIDYLHEGGAHHWYIIPSSEREILQNLIDKQNSTSCLDHGQILIDPLMLDKYHIRYYRIIQQPNEFVILSAGTIAQSFTEDISWSESIDFALPSWIREGHANNSMSSCRCNISRSPLSKTVDISLFRDELIQRYITSYLHPIIENQTILSTGENSANVTSISSYNNQISSSN